MRNDGLKKHFFFPGWTTATGGLLREPQRLATVARAQASEANRIESLHAIGLAPLGHALSEGHTRLVSVFCYPQAPIADLLHAISRHWRTDRTWICLAGHTRPDLGQSCPANVHINHLPMLSHDHYDVLLQSCDLNVVRGEDSLVRAIWAARPFLWHIYPQDEQAHLAKLDAWLVRSTLPASVHTLQRAFNMPDDAQNGAPDTVLQVSAAQALGRDWSAWEDAVQHDCAALATQADLADNIVAFFTMHAISR